MEGGGTLKPFGPERFTESSRDREIERTFTVDISQQPKYPYWMRGPRVPLCPEALGKRTFRLSEISCAPMPRAPALRLSDAYYELLKRDHLKRGLCWAHVSALIVSGARIFDLGSANAFFLWGSAIAVDGRRFVPYLLNAKGSAGVYWLNFDAELSPVCMQLAFRPVSRDT